MPTTPESPSLHSPFRMSAALRRLEPAHGVNALSDVILGGQDGLVNVLGVVLGVAAASGDVRIVIAGGLAATFAESISMGAVAYTSTQADHEFYLSEVERERREMRELPDVERQEVREIFQRWGLQGELLEQAVAKVVEDEEAWLDVMMRNELHIAPVEAGRPLRSAIVVGLSAIVGSLIPLAAFLFMPIASAIWVSLAVSALALFGVGVYKAKALVGRPLRSGTQMAVIGIASALAGYAIGFLFGAT